MNRSDIANVVQSLRQLVGDRDFQEILSRQEMSVRYILFDPALRALGWATEDPDLVQVEFNVTNNWSLGPNADYALMHGRNKPVLFIETKYASRKFDEAVRQGMERIDKCTRGDVRSFVVTDGRRYERYDYLPGQQPKKVMEFDITTGEIDNAAQNLVLCLGMPTTAVAAG